MTKKNVLSFNKGRATRSLNALLETLKPATHERRIIISKAKIPGGRWKQPRWVVIVSFGDGSLDWEHGPADKEMAIFLAHVWQRKYGYPIVDWSCHVLEGLK